MNYLVTKNYETEFTNPISLTAGEKVTIGEESSEQWLNWVYCTKNDHSNAGWVPKQIINYADETILEDYSAKEMNVKKGEIVEGLKELNGWLWAKNKATDEIGWIPLEVLESMNTNLIGYCGIYCGACPSYKSGECEGCRAKSEKSSVRYKACAVKPCCIENEFFTCADCTIYASTKECKKYNPLLLKIASWVEKTDRSKAIEMIKIKGLAETVAFMEEKQWVCFKVKDSWANKRYGKRVKE